MITTPGDGMGKKPVPRRVTQKDVAASLGVSQGMVARVLNGDQAYSPATRQRVFDAAAALGYGQGTHQDVLSLASRRRENPKRTGIIGCVGFSPKAWGSLPFKVQQLEGILAGVEEAGLELLQLQSQFTAGWEKVDGVVMDGATRETFNLCLEFSIPMVTMMSERSGNPSVLADDFDGMAQATRHLLELGHRNIGYLVDQVAEQSSVSLRMAGYRHALSEAGLEPRPELIAPLFNTGAFLERGRHSMRVWLEAGWKASGCTALLVQNDRAAIGAMQTLREAGIRVPEDVSVMGFDGTEECELCTPRLSTVAVPLREIGQKAVEFLLQQMDGCAAHQKTITLPVFLDLRDSTAPLQRGRIGNQAQNNVTIKTQRKEK